MGLFDTAIAWLRGGKPTAEKAPEPEASGVPAPPTAPTVAERMSDAMNRGRRLVVKADYRSAIAAFDEVVTEVPLYPLAYADRGSAHALLGDLAAAEADLDRAVVLMPQDMAPAWSRVIETPRQP